ncbi:MAG TPA: hypothetical protein VGW40_07345 [Allosphingosinicella sp.]|nr:hypothetical protein [Allosphingosinicella sp.]
MIVFSSNSRSSIAVDRDERGENKLAPEGKIGRINGICRADAQRRGRESAQSLNPDFSLISPLRTCA